MIQLPEDYLPEWARYLLATILGAGGLQWFRAWLENRRLSKKDFRELLLDRISQQDLVIDRMQIRMGNVCAELANQVVENEQLKKERDAKQQEEGGSDGNSE